MIQIQNSPGKLIVIGHAAETSTKSCEESRNACVSITALVKSLISGIKSLCHEKPSYLMQSGKFVLDKTKLTGSSLFLIDAFMCGAYDLSLEYHEYIRLYDISGLELESERHTESHKPSYPDWKNFLVGKTEEHETTVSDEGKEVKPEAGRWLD